MMNLGDDVQEKTLKYYFAYKRIKNFACVEVYTQSNKLQVYVKLNPDEIQLEEGFTRDVRNIGHFSTGDLEITIRNEEDLTIVSAPENVSKEKVQEKVKSKARWILKQLRTFEKYQPLSRPKNFVFLTL